MIPEIPRSQSNSVIYLDTSYLLDQQSCEYIMAQNFDLRITDGVVNEVRAQSKDVRFNTYLDFLLNKTPIVSRSYFRRLRMVTAYDVIRSLARQYHPYIASQLQRIAKSSIEPEQKLKQMISEVAQVSHKGAIWKASYEYFTSQTSPFPDKTKKPRHRFYESVLSNIPLVHKAWYKYHNKRIKQELAGHYMYTDEDLVAAALTETLAGRKRAIILTRDPDLNIIVWQFENNLILGTCVQDLTPSAEIGLSKFWAEFTSRCEAFNAAVRMEINKRLGEVLKSEGENSIENSKSTLFLITGRGDVLVLCHGEKYASFNAYIYPKFITTYLGQVINYYEKIKFQSILIPTKNLYVKT